jgi:hypothetical protein
VTFRAPDLKKAIKAAQDMGLAVVSFEIGPDGIRIFTGTEAKNEADAALDRWMKTNGKGS